MYCDALLPLLVASGCATAVGTDVFVDMMPADVRQGIVLLSPLSGVRIRYDLGPNYRSSDRFQMLVRSPARDAGLTLALSATKALTILTQTFLPAVNLAPAMQLQYMRPVCDPIVYPRQINKVWEISVNFEATYAIISSGSAGYNVSVALVPDAAQIAIDVANEAAT